MSKSINLVNVAATIEGMLWPAKRLNLAILPSKLTIARVKPSAKLFRLYPLWHP